MSRWQWRSEESRSGAPPGSRRCSRIWHMQSPLAGFAVRMFRYADGETTIHYGRDPNGIMEFLSGHNGAHALRDAMRALRQAYALRLARAFAELET